jgi:SOS response regulatory protein OraA/RecX
VHAGFSRDAADEVIADMLREGYINERRQLERLIESEVKRNLIGPKKLIPKLLAKGFSRTDINDALDALAADGVIDFSEAKRQLVMKKLGDSPDSEEVKKLLYKHGFSHSDDL